MSPCCSLWPLRCQKHSGTETSRREKTGWVDVFLRWLGWLKIINFQCFFWPLKSKIDSPRSRNAHFYTWVTRLPIEMNVHIANIFWQVPQIPAFCPLASKIIISNSSPLQGRRLPCLPKGDPKGDWSNMISLAGEQLIQQHETKFALNNVILSTAAGCMGRFSALGLQHYQMSNRLDHRFSKLGEIHQIGKYIRSTRAHHGHHGLFTWHYIIMIVHFPFLCSKNRSVSGRHHPRSLASHHSRPVASSQCRRKGLTRHGGFPPHGDSTSGDDNLIAATKCYKDGGFNWVQLIKMWLNTFQWIYNRVSLTLSVTPCKGLLTM